MILFYNLLVKKSPYPEWFLPSLELIPFLQASSHGFVSFGYEDKTFFKDLCMPMPLSAMDISKNCEDCQFCTQQMGGVCDCACA